MSTSQQQLFLVFSRHNLNPSLIPPFKIIIPTLQLISPLRLFTSMQRQITLGKINSISSFSNLYESLVDHLENQEGEVNLNKTFNMIYTERLHQQQDNKRKNLQGTNPWKFRICLIGEEIISWDIVMKFKLKNIIVDTLGLNKRLQQISFATGGISRSLAQNQNITKLFMALFSLSTQCRKKFSLLHISKGEQTSWQSIEFTVDCVCCRPECKELSNECYLCSKCLSVHCSKISETCFQCGTMLENIQLKHKPC